MTNKQLAEEILQKVGGKKNINSYSHCSTRLRLDLKDKNFFRQSSLGKNRWCITGNGSCRTDSDRYRFSSSICI